MTVAFFHFICLRVTYMTIYKKAANSKTSDFPPFYSSKRIISNLFIVVTGRKNTSTKELVGY
jgi:hypothetical protein